MSLVNSGRAFGTRSVCTRAHASHIHTGAQTDCLSPSRILVSRQLSGPRNEVTRNLFSPPCLQTVACISQITVLDAAVTFLCNSSARDEALEAIASGYVFMCCPHSAPYLPRPYGKEKKEAAPFEAASFRITPVKICRLTAR